MDTLPVKPDRLAALEAYARQHGKEAAEVLDDVLARFLEYEMWFSQAVDKGVAAADRGEFIEHDDVAKLIESRYPG
jgi:predicted transcriptional regulator